jgi:hypothetical protein
MRAGSDRVLALAPRNSPAAPNRSSLAVRLGTKALVSLAKSVVSRRAVLVGAAFGVGYQIRKITRSGGLPRCAVNLQGIYSEANGGISAGEQPLGDRVRASITIVSAIYRSFDQDEAQ